MIFLLMSLVAAVILFPVLYFLPLSLTLKGKAILTVLAFAISAASFAAMDHMPLWQLFGLMALLVLVISYVGATRMEGFLLIPADGTDEESSAIGADLLFGRWKKQEQEPAAENGVSPDSYHAITETAPVLPHVNREPDEGYIGTLHVESEEQKETINAEDMQIMEEAELAELESKEDESVSEELDLYSESIQDEDYISPLEDLPDENEALGKEGGLYDYNAGTIPDSDSENGQEEGYISPLEDLLEEYEADVQEDKEIHDDSGILEDDFTDSGMNKSSSELDQDEEYISPLEDLLNEDDMYRDEPVEAENKEANLEDFTVADSAEAKEEPAAGAEPLPEEAEQEIPVLEDYNVDGLSTGVEDESPETEMADIEEADEVLQAPEWDELEPQEDEQSEESGFAAGLIEADGNGPAERPFVDTFLEQIGHYQTVMEPDELEVFIKTHLSETMPDSDYFLTAIELLKLYQNTKQLEKFHQLVVTLNAKFGHYPLLQEQIRFLYEQFLITNQRW